MLSRDFLDVVNRHVDQVADLHRIRFTERAEHIMVIECVCGFRGDRRNFNDHMRDVYKVHTLAARSIA